MFNIFVLIDFDAYSVMTFPRLGSTTQIACSHQHISNINTREYKNVENKRYLQ